MAEPLQQQTEPAAKRARTEAQLAPLRAPQPGPQAQLAPLQAQQPGPQAQLAPLQAPQPGPQAQLAPLQAQQPGPQAQQPGPQAQLAPLQAQQPGPQAPQPGPLPGLPEPAALALHNAQQELAAARQHIQWLQQEVAAARQHIHWLRQEVAAAQLSVAEERAWRLQARAALEQRNACIARGKQQLMESIMKKVKGSVDEFTQLIRSTNEERGQGPRAPPGVGPGASV
ncbi:hypothetical protein Rsub_00543 [Raphidocelis subcapitata]|uniref:Uncharacterized protein n=1 Tax=Raphidocelis subcapitata TaxID=307507 RepID=A0A2V0NKI5_9CHLO|nr:hypothetical protein Rsub_00543 [Raphidocelis subcapitata]|eukprot:GBF87831.1 hypothetical protein Rsub_00543 [Raphidocelis subcapitata]